jgi:F0F1-type ATP synthase membrane subunit c/vacuolar-type H+-ATPase subunit K
MVDIKEEAGKSTGTLVIETIAGLMSAAFAFVAALAWNTAIQKAILSVFPNPDDLTGVFIYAIIVTIIAVIAIIYIGRVLAKYHARDAKRGSK